ncbi:methyltransferase domain-containing protein [Patescibacteria group bacterium]|nr:methyltransferase domain-containing protein [Patescibacteria group bacterium]
MEHHQHRFTYYESERRKRQNPEQILHNAGLKEGMCFMDIGCNNGFFTLPAAKIVGENGKIYAVDIDNDALNELKDKLLLKNISNVKDPLKVLKNAKTMLKDKGVVYDYDWRKVKTELGPPLQIRLSTNQVKQLAESAGLRFGASNILDKNFYAVVLEKT